MNMIKEKNLRPTDGMMGRRLYFLHFYALIRILKEREREKDGQKVNRKKEKRKEKGRKESDERKDRKK